MLEPPSPPARPALRPVPRWVIVVGIPAMVLVAAAAVWVLLGTGAGGDQLDAIRTGSTLGIGLGGIVLLWLAVRRQRSTELDLLQKYEAHQLAERVAAAGERDATARRITDLYAKAVDQLGSAQAPVRLGGLYALERLAQDNADPQLRQTVVNMICAYLRMPASGAEEPGFVQQEREVRLTAQRILENHLKPGSDPERPDGRFWADTDIDLSGATLTDLDLSRSRIRAANFGNADFTGGVSFDNARFDGPVRCHDAKFSRLAAFTHTHFTKSADFRGAEFRDYAWFDHTKFTGNVTFENATFTQRASFGDSEFEDLADFDRVVFKQSTEFNRVTFRGDAWFGEVEVAEEATFHGARFEEDARFERTRFGGTATFDSVVFANGATFEETEFAQESSFAFLARVDGVESDRWWWPEGWAPDGEPAPVDELPGAWVSLVRVHGDGSRVHEGA